MFPDSDFTPYPGSKRHCRVTFRYRDFQVTAAADVCQQSFALPVAGAYSLYYFIADFNLRSTPGQFLFRNIGNQVTETIDMDDFSAYCSVG
jgi:hypothetical protein